MASSLDVTSLSEYVNEKNDELLTKAVLGANTLNHIDVMLNVKFKDALNYLDSSLVFADGSVCGWNPEGSDVFSQRFIEVAPIKINKEWCAKDLRKYWMNYDLNFAAGRETLPFEQKIVDNNLETIKVELDKEIWQNDASALFEGFVSKLTVGDASTCIDASIGASYDGQDVIDVVYDNATSAMLANGMKIFVSPTVYRSVVRSLNAVCCNNRPEIDAAAGTMTYPGDSRVQIVEITGLEGATDANSKAVLAIGTTGDNLVFGTDVENSENIFKFWQDDKTDMFCFKVLFNAGVAVKFPDQVVYLHEA